MFKWNKKTKLQANELPFDQNIKWQTHELKTYLSVNVLLSEDLLFHEYFAYISLLFLFNKRETPEGSGPRFENQWIMDLPLYPSLVKNTRPLSAAGLEPMTCT